MRANVDLPTAPGGEVCAFRGAGVDVQLVYFPGAKTRIVVENAGEYAVIKQRVDMRQAKVGDVIEIDDWVPQAPPPAPVEEVAAPPARKRRR